MSSATGLLFNCHERSIFTRNFGWTCHSCSTPPMRGNHWLWQLRTSGTGYVLEQHAGSRDTDELVVQVVAWGWCRNLQTSTCFSGPSFFFTSSQIGVQYSSQYYNRVVQPNTKGLPASLIVGTNQTQTLRSNDKKEQPVSGLEQYNTPH